MGTKWNLPIKDRFMSYVSIPENKNDCWIWIGGKVPNGYGKFYIKDETLLAHRVSFELFVGNIPKNMYVLHQCDTPACVNPFHLFLGTPQDNMTDKIKKGRQVYVKGENHGNHKLTEQDIYKIREMIECGYTNKEIADMFEVNRNTISSIRTNRNWNWLK